MGEVYRARDTRLDRDVAVKVLPPHLSAFDAAPPKILFKSPRALTGTVSPSCDRILLAPRPQGAQTASIGLVSNWPALLKK